MKIKTISGVTSEGNPYVQHTITDIYRIIIQENPNKEWFVYKNSKGKIKIVGGPFMKKTKALSFVDKYYLIKEKV